MRTYAEYLNTMTVKALNASAKQMGLKGYSKLRKAELIEFIDAAISELMPVILSVEVETDIVPIAAIMAEVAVTFTEQSTVKAAEMSATMTESDDADTDEAEDLIYAYRAMRATLHKATGKLHSRIAARLRAMSAALKSLGVDMRTV